MDIQNNSGTKEEITEQNKSWIKRHWILSIVLVVILIFLIFQYLRMWGSYKNELSIQSNQSEGQIVCPKLSNMILYGYDSQQSDVWVADKVEYKTSNEQLFYSDTNYANDLNTAGFINFNTTKTYYICDLGSKHIELNGDLNNNYTDAYVYCGDFIRPIVLYKLDVNGHIINSAKTSVEIIFDSKTKKYIDTKCGTYELVNVP